MRRVHHIVIALAIVLLLPTLAHAQATNQGVDQVLTRLQAATGAWSAPLQTIVQRTFGALAVIDLVYFVGIRSIVNGGFDLSNIFANFINEVLYLSFMVAVLLLWVGWAPSIIQGFQQAGNMAGGGPVTPNDVFNSGINISTKIAGQASVWHPGDAIVEVLCGLIVLGCFLWIVISMVIIIAESVTVIAGGQMVLMFGGLRLTSDMPMSLLRATIACGLKLFALQLLANIGTAFVQDWVNQSAAAATVTFESIAVQIGETIVLAALVTGVPHLFERLAGSGASIGGAGNVAAAGAAIGAAGSLIGKSIVKALAQTGGTAQAGVAAARLAGAQLAAKTEAGQGPTSAAGRAASLVGSTAQNLASAKMTDIGRGLRGTRSNLGSSPWRQASDLDERRRTLSEKTNKTGTNNP
jgi:P-type conjugative transfer protein TrbL